MVLTLGTGQQFGDIVVIESLPETHGPGLGDVGPGGGWRQHLVQTDAQGGVDDLLERLAEFAGTAPGLGSDIRIKRQSGAHEDIMMSVA